MRNLLNKIGVIYVLWVKNSRETLTNRAQMVKQRESVSLLSMTKSCETLIEFLKSWSSFQLVRIPVQYLCSFITAIYFRLVRISKFLNALLRVCYLD